MTGYGCSPGTATTSLFRGLLTYMMEATRARELPERLTRSRSDSNAACLEPHSRLAGVEPVGRSDAGNSHVRFDEFLRPRIVPTNLRISSPILPRRTLPSAVLWMSEEQRDCVYRAALECCAALLRLMSSWKIQDFDLRNCNNRAAFLEARQQACRTTLPLERVKELLNQRALEDRTARVLQCVLSQLNDKLAIADS
jgi:hypothetical protein